VSDIFNARRTMPRVLTVVTIALLAGCTAEEAPEAEPLQTPGLADFAGSWNMTVVFPATGS
jgi:hypothetical protein